MEYIYDEDKDSLEQKLKEQELYWIENLGTLDREKGYNLRLDSEGKCIVSDETREKCRESQIKRFSDENVRKELSDKLKTLRKEHPEYWEESKVKLAYANRKYRIAKCDKNTGEIIKIYEIIKEISDENPDYYLQAIKGCC